MERQGTFADVSDEYAAFVEKFKPKKTTDDCYTPDNIYQAVLDWAAARYGFDKAAAVRPFWPGGDYEAFDYPEDCVVVDNPPFSILAKITAFYNRNGVRFFLFCPGLMMNGARQSANNYICTGSTITYENGAGVPTNFVTNMGEYRIESAPDLADAIEEINKRNVKATKKQIAKVRLPDEIVTAGRMNYLAQHHVRFVVRREESAYLHGLDNYNVFGGCLLLSERAAERAAAERAAAIPIELSEREKAMVRHLSKEVRGAPMKPGDVIRRKNAEYPEELEVLPIIGRPDEMYVRATARSVRPGETTEEATRRLVLAFGMAREDEMRCLPPRFGVPISYLYKHNPEQFRIVGKLRPVMPDGTEKYQRILLEPTEATLAKIKKEQDR